MTTPEITAARQTFDAAIAIAKTPDDVFVALQDFVRQIVGARLFTVMLVDMEAELSRRAYTSDPVSYPASGTKPLHYDRWFDTVHKARQPFVANSIDDIATVFADYELIDSLGCQSVVNLPVVLADELVGTINMLDAADHYTPERVELIVREVSIPAKLAVALAERLQ